MKSRDTVCWSMLAALLALGTGTAAHAHAGLPETSSFTQRRGHPEDLFMGASFGAVISRDSGQTWRWICRDAMGYGGWNPEAYLWREAGDIIAATGSAVLRSPDGGCTWNTHPYFKDTWVTALASHPTDDALLYVTTGRSTVANGVYRSRDGGETWEPTSLLRTGVVFNAVRVSPSDPRRVYATAEAGRRLLLFRSDDAGDTWQELEPPLPADLLNPYALTLSAVSPASADVVWLRVSSQGYTHLLRSDDGGQTLAHVHKLDDVYVNMDLSADGHTVWVGTISAFFRGPDTGPLKKLILPTGNACVTRVGETLYGCGSTWLHDWALGRSTDQGSNWEHIFGLYEIQGTHLCPKGTPVRDICPSRWPQQAEELGAPLYPDGGVEEPPPETPPDAGTPDAGPDGNGQPQPPPPPAKGDGCGAAAGSATSTLFLLSTLTLLRRGRRRTDDR